ncbi:hypothetical protein [Rhizobium sp. BK176]|uniref:hypothetical protein n=1 Tax=Rhizobium sp. BK176 TaxID=2587071 RepID=UPI00216743B9|nr:hypothetical protein [Rhizobium sp. BK176]MCS4089210.1 hypothetical protein [Rhizobium sp. BK176]
MQALWAAEVVRFLKDNLPGDQRQGWDHRYVTAYQMGCEALSALGHADERSWGAVARIDPAIPDTLPRWDDVVAVVLGVLNQNDHLGFTGTRASDNRSKIF